MKQAIEVRLSQMVESGELEKESPAAMAIFFLALVVAETGLSIERRLNSIAQAIDDIR